MMQRVDSRLVDALVSDRSPDVVETVITQLLCAVRTHLGLDVVYVSRIRCGIWRLHGIDAPGREDILGQPGEIEMPAAETLCGMVLRGTLPNLMNDAATNPTASAMPCIGALGIRANISVPVTLPTGEPFGMLCGFSTEPDPSLNARDVRIMRAFADVAAVAIEAELLTERGLAEKRARIEPMLEYAAPITTVLQPIWDLSGAVPFGAEALCRFQSQPPRTPDHWFNEAAEIGLGAALDLAALRRALDTLQDLPPDLQLFVNTSPATILNPVFEATLRTAPLQRIVIEITEHAVVDQYEPLTTALMPLRRDGLLVAVDDAGGGYSSFKHIIRLCPDVIKADMSIVRDVDTCPSRRAMLSALATFARETGTLFLAEGVETAAELATLSDLGVDLVQGFYLGRPGPADDVETGLALGRSHLKGRPAAPPMLRRRADPEAA